MSYTGAINLRENASISYINFFGYLTVSSYTAPQLDNRGALQQAISATNNLSGSIALLINSARYLGESS